MQRRFSPIGRASIWTAVVSFFAVTVFPLSAHAYTPKSPEVQRLISRAIEFLKSDRATDNRPGGKALIGLALLKNGAGEQDPKVVEAVNAIQGTLGNRNPKELFFSEMYSPGVAAIFLITLDPNRYATEIQCLLDYLQLQQKPHGGWGYPERETGDTSMTQYAVLCSWEASHAGFRVPIESIDRVAAWLLKTQDPSGGYGYQGVVSDSFMPVTQANVRNSLTAAGLGSVYICTDMLGLVARAEDRDDGLPSALKEVESREQQRDRQKVKTGLDPRLFRGVQARGTRWMVANYAIDPRQWTHYYLFALERYHSFRELSETGPELRKPAESLKWYDDGVRFLTKTQGEDGSWAGNVNAAIDTAFSVLFLTRSTKKSIEKARSFGDGTMLGGRGLPKETGRAEVRMGSVVAKPLLGPAEELLAVLEDKEDADYERALELLAELPPQELETLMGGQAAKLRRLAGGEAPQARVAALRALAKTRNLDNVPTLIYALGDANLDVVREARDALRRMSRKPSGFGLPERPTSEADRRAAIAQWKAWYLAVRPDAEFEN